MKSPQLSVFLKTFPRARYHSESRLLTWYPQGTLDDQLADEIMAVLELDESFENVPFHRYTDLSRLTEIHLKIGHVFEIAEHRRTVGEPVRSALFAETTMGFGIARLYEELMQGAVIQVRAFRDRDAAAEWLGADVQLLLSE
ncbi:MAG TPA: hypothetical protein VK961_22525 [Chthoniobacter sp.]|nr:hypothetical protein [Chthoniobacter sp.]